MRHATLVLVAAGFGLAALGCETLIGARFDDAELASPEDAADAPECTLLRPPERPELPPAGDELEFVVVIDRVEYGDSSSSADETVGYDLDGQCTNRGDPPNCAPASWVQTDLTDGVKGQDNAVGKLLGIQDELFGDRLVTSERLNMRVVMGVDAPLGVIRISNFGAMVNDDHVRVEWFVPAPLGASAALDGSDEWPIVEDFLKEDAVGASSVYEDADAFVTKSTLVARFPAVHLPLMNVYFDVSEAVLTATIVLEPTQRFWLLQDGVIAAWIDVDSLLPVIPEIAYSLSTLPQCTDDAANYPDTKRYICGLADLPALEHDGEGTVPCNRASVGMRFGASPAKIGRGVALEPPASFCPMETDPRYDTCAAPP